MDFYQVVLSPEELQIPAIMGLFDKYLEFVRLAEENPKTRKTRTHNDKKMDAIYDEIMNFKMPPITVKDRPIPTSEETSPSKSSNNKLHTSTTSSVSPPKSAISSSEDEEEDGSTRRLRSLRSRSRTPVNGNYTPTHQKLRSHKNIPSSTGSSNCSSNSSSLLLNSAMSQHPQSATKLRQLLRADSAQKKRLEERERSQRLQMDRKIKEERAEAQKKQILEERANIAKLKREQRIQKAADLRKAREEEKAKLAKEEATKKLKHTHPTPLPSVIQQQPFLHLEVPQLQPLLPQQPQSEYTQQKQEKIPVRAPPKPQLAKTQKMKPPIPPEAPPVLNTKVQNETFVQNKDDESNNIEISVQDTTTDEKQNTNNGQQAAPWARAPELRNALVAQFNKPDSERARDIAKVFPPVKLPVELDVIFAGKPGRHLVRTSSAVWSPPPRPMKRSISMVNTPTH